MEASGFRLLPRAWALVVAALICGGYAFSAARVAQVSAVRDVRAGDQLNLAIMVVKIEDPSLFPRDHTFGDLADFAYYTPSFLHLTAWLDQWTGDPARSWALLLGPVLFVYLMGMFLALHQVARHAGVALGLALLSARPHLATPLEVWGMAGLDYVLPRSLALALVPWLLFAALRHQQIGWKVVLVAAGVGLLANLHPGTGLHAAALFLPLCWLAAGVRRTHWVALAALGVLAGALPMLLGFLGGSGSADLGGSWGEFTGVVQNRLAGYVFPFRDLTQGGVDLAARARGFAVAQAVLVVAGLAALRWPRLDRVVFVAWGASVLPLAALVVSRGEAQPLLWLWVGFIVAAALSRPTRLDWGIVLCLALVLVHVFVVTPLMQSLWLKRELAWLGSFAMEHGRLSRFAYLPLYLAAARLAALLIAWWRPPLVRIALPLVVVAVCAWPWRGLPARMLPDKPRPAAPADEELHLWARTQTANDALFFHAHGSSLAFRYHARRAITHSWKDLSAAIYRRSELLPEWRRFREYQAVAADPTALVRVVVRDDVDYVVRTTAEPPLPLPVAFENASWRVYGR